MNMIDNKYKNKLRKLKMHKNKKIKSLNYLINLSKKSSKPFQKYLF